MDRRPIASLALILALSLAGAAHAQSCFNDQECQDGSWCNGVERCEGNPGNGTCMPAPRPMCLGKKVCDEGTKQCLAPKQVDELLGCPKGQTYSAAAKKCVATPPPQP